MARISTRHQP
jgi:predicted component of type VI protein secretion system